MGARMGVRTGLFDLLAVLRFYQSVSLYISISFSHVVDISLLLTSLKLLLV